MSRRSICVRVESLGSALVISTARTILRKWRAAAVFGLVVLLSSGCARQSLVASDRNIQIIITSIIEQEDDSTIIATTVFNNSNQTAYISRSSISTYIQHKLVYLDNASKPQVFDCADDAMPIPSPPPPRLDEILVLPKQVIDLRLVLSEPPASDSLRTRCGSKVPVGIDDVCDLAIKTTTNTLFMPVVCQGTPSIICDNNTN